MWGISLTTLTCVAQGLYSDSRAAKRSQKDSDMRKDFQAKAHEGTILDPKPEEVLSELGNCQLPVTIPFIRWELGSERSQQLLGGTWFEIWKCQFAVRENYNEGTAQRYVWR